MSDFRIQLKLDTGYFDDEHEQVCMYVCIYADVPNLSIFVPSAVKSVKLLVSEDH